MFRYDCTDVDQSPTAQFETEFAAAVGCKYALAVNSCGSSLQLALLSAGAKPGDFVLVPGFTFTAVTSAIVNCGCHPVLVDIADDYCIDIADLQRKFRPEIRFLLMSYMRGRVARLDSVLELCRSRGVIVIEDCAHSLGTSWRGRPTGVFGAASCFSFHDKLLSSGEGGILATNSDQILMRATVMSGAYERMWSRHLSRPSMQNPYQGHLAQFSMRMNAVTAAILRPQVSLIDQFAQQYRDRYRLITSLLSKSRYVRIPDTDEHALLVSNTVLFEMQNMSEEAMSLAIERLAETGIPLARLGPADGNDRCVWNWHYLAAGVEQTVPQCVGLLRNTCDLRIRRTMSDSDIATIALTITTFLEAAALAMPDRQA
jgi:dTDP-4-amino-4,6-dideoxygalactose transaminase